MRILIAEDDQVLADGLLRSLRTSGAVVDHVANGAEADTALVTHNHFDLLILDLGLPRIHGLEVLRRLRSRGDSLPVLILTAADAVEERVKGLDLGADDYMAKPFSLQELEARVRALARRPREDGTALLAGDALQVDPHARRARWQGTDLQLSPKEYALLELLLRQRGKVLSRAAIFDRLYDSASEASDKVVEVIVSTLRGKLAKAGAPDPIHTRRGFGYAID